VVGAGCALLISFLVLAILWRTPRLTGATSGRLLPGWVGTAADSPVLHVLVRVLGLVIAGYTAWAALAGADSSANPSLGVFYIYLWVGLVPLSLLFGNVFPLLSPMRTIHLLVSRGLGSPPDQGLIAYPRWLGYWPAAVGLFTFVWTELVNPRADHVSTVVTWCAVYVAVMLIGSAIFGDRFLSRADPFEAWFGLVAKLSPWGRRDVDGRRRVVVRNPLDNLDTVDPDPGLVALVSVLLGSTAYDSFSTSIFWLRTTSVPGVIDPTVLDTLVLVGFVVLVMMTVSVASVIGTGLPWPQRRLLPRQMAHSLVPIGVGYIFAHYLTLLLETGQAYVVFLSDPLVTGDANYLGTADWTVVYFLSLRPTLLATLKVGFVLTGHILAVIAAHDRAVKVLPERSQVSGQLAMLVLMLFYTVGGLLLLFNA
jgi:hypothetical protein